MKQLQLNLGEYGKGFLKKDDQLLELILMNLKTSCGMFYLEFHTSWAYIDEYGNDYTFGSLYGLLIWVHEKLIDQGRPENKKQAHLIKGKG